jgi:Tol biopolymer transport system component
VSEDPAPTSSSRDAADRLDSWKEIASYLRRDVSTVQRWEKREGMPVHRHVHDKLGSVHAFRTELDAWISRRLHLGPESTETPDASPAALLTTWRPPMTADSLPSQAAAIAIGVEGAQKSTRTWWPLLAVVAVLGVALVLRVFPRTESAWQNPLADARFQQLTDFDGTERAAAISGDGRLVAFLADRDDVFDLWMTQVGTGEFHNLTKGRLRDVDNPDVRDVAFSADASLVSVWFRKSTTSNPPDIGVWGVPALGGDPRPYLDGVAEYDWSRADGRLVYHTPGPGDPMFVKDRPDATPRQIWVAPAGTHAHFPVWSPDGQFIYFVYGTLPDRLDIWRIAPSGGMPERITSHNSRVTHPVFMDSRTLVYVATDADGAGPWIYGIDIEQRMPHRLSAGVERYTSIAASTDARRLVATIANETGTLWRMPMTAGVADPDAAVRVTLPTTRGRSPRYGPNYLLYVSGRGPAEGIWKLTDTGASEIWSAPGARVIGGPALAADGSRVAFSADANGRARLYVMNADGSAARVVSEALEPRGAPAWAPDARSLIVPVTLDREPRLVRVWLDGRAPTPLVGHHSVDPTWAPEGDWLLYSGPDVGTTFQVHAVGLDGKPRPFKELTLSRGARRIAFLRGQHALVLLRGEVTHKNFALVDLDTGTERALTDFARDFLVRDFDVSPDGREIVFDQVRENSDVVLIDRK